MKIFIFFPTSEMLPHLSQHGFQPVCLSCPCLCVLPVINLLIPQTQSLTWRFQTYFILLLCVCVCIPLWSPLVVLPVMFWPSDTIVFRIFLDPNKRSSENLRLYWKCDASQTVCMFCRCCCKPMCSTAGFYQRPSFSLISALLRVADNRAV